MPRALFIAAHRLNRSPGQRFRFEQYFDFLEANGWQCELSYLIDKNDDKHFYQPGRILKKAGIVLKSFRKRQTDVNRANDYDLIFLQREAFMTGYTGFEKAFGQSKTPVIFDFDDAIWKMDVSEANRKLSFLKNPDKTKELIGYADLVFAGNSYLADYAKQYNSNVEIVPTTIDTNYLVPKASEKQKEKLAIGWTGSLTTVRHFESILPTLKKLQDQNENFTVLKIGQKAPDNPPIEVEFRQWTRATEVTDLQAMDIGIMPLPDDEWARGKCGFKGLQYMACGIPTIMSPVGVNAEIIEDGVNGFLAATEEEWIKKLTILLNDPALRKKLGEAGRKTIIERYSVAAFQQKYLDAFNSLAARK